MRSFCVTGWVRQSASTRNTVPENYFREIPQKSWWANPAASQYSDTGSEASKRSTDSSLRDKMEYFCDGYF